MTEINKCAILLFDDHIYIYIYKSQIPLAIFQKISKRTHLKFGVEVIVIL